MHIHTRAQHTHVKIEKEKKEAEILCCRSFPNLHSHVMDRFLPPLATEVSKVIGFVYRIGYIDRNCLNFLLTNGFKTSPLQGV